MINPTELKKVKIALMITALSVLFSFSKQNHLSKSNLGSALLTSFHIDLDITPMKDKSIQIKTRSHDWDVQTIDTEGNVGRYDLD